MGKAARKAEKAAKTEKRRTWLRGGRAKETPKPKEPPAKAPQVKTKEAPDGGAVPEASQPQKPPPVPRPEVPPPTPEPAKLEKPAEAPKAEAKPAAPTVEVEEEDDSFNIFSAKPKAKGPSTTTAPKPPPGQEPTGKAKPSGKEGAKAREPDEVLPPEEGAGGEAEDGAEGEDGKPKRKRRKKNEPATYDECYETALWGIKLLDLMTRGVALWGLRDYVEAGVITREDMKERVREMALEEEELDALAEPAAEMLERERASLPPEDRLMLAAGVIFGNRVIDVLELRADLAARASEKGIKVGRPKEED